MPRQMNKSQLTPGGVVFAAAIALVYVYSFPYFSALHSANELPRIYLSVALVERGQLSIDPELRRFQRAIDTSTYKGRTYSNKAPGMSLLGVPVYAAHKALNGWRTPKLIHMMWSFRFFVSTVPTLLFLILLSAFLRDFGLRTHIRRLVVLAYGLGTMALVYGTLLISHQLCAVLLGTSFALLFRRRGRYWAAWAGLAAGGAVLVEYPAAFVGPALFLYTLVRGRPRVRAGLHFGLAAALPLGALLVYHYLCFDSPFKTGLHFHTHSAMRQWASTGFLGLGAFRPAELFQQTLSPRSGLFHFSPFLLLAIPGFVMMLRRAGRRAEAMLCLFSVLGALAFIASLRYAHGGWTVGPRYIGYTLPFYLPAVALCLQRCRGRWAALAALSLIALSILTHVTAAAIFPHYPEPFENPWYDLTLRFLRAGYAPYNLGWSAGLRGIESLLPMLLVVATLSVAVFYRLPRRTPLLVTVGTMLVCGAMVIGQRYELCLQNQAPPEKMLRWIGQIWQPRHKNLRQQQLLLPSKPPACRR